MFQVSMLSCHVVLLVVLSLSSSSPPLLLLLLMMMMMMMKSRDEMYTKRFLCDFFPFHSEYLDRS